MTSNTFVRIKEHVTRAHFDHVLAADYFVCRKSRSCFSPTRQPKGISKKARIMRNAVVLFAFSLILSLGSAQLTAEEKTRPNIVIAALRHDITAKDETIKYLEGEVVRLQRLVEEVEQSHKGCRAKLNSAEHEAGDLSEKMETIQQMHDVESRERLICVEERDRQYRELSNTKRSLVQCELATTHHHSSIHECEERKETCLQELQETQRSHDQLESQFSLCREQEVTFEKMRKEHQVERARWLEMEQKHREQIEEFQEGWGEADHRSPNFDEEPHPEIGSERYRALLKAQEMLYRQESMRRNAMQEQQEFEQQVIQAQEEDIAFNEKITAAREENDSDAEHDESSDPEPAEEQRNAL